eukprot:CAMPEP_0194303702 /NCGR_PEP_ID=MMETSP0171-20130528/1524_1 /TAXON_ID=218684 /ORGANISM="Corethron pennatum, Strain L29A3" /LENGTH=960 /DNA_ID=CAMNT_0039054699 /DNA_START=274 /DNA_END=3156 /DNA_ORIENTATION=-
MVDAWKIARSLVVSRSSTSSTPDVTPDVTPEVSPSRNVSRQRSADSLAQSLAYSNQSSSNLSSEGDHYFDPEAENPTRLGRAAFRPVPLAPGAGGYGDAEFLDHGRYDPRIRGRSCSESFADSRAESESDGGGGAADAHGYGYGHGYSHGYGYDAPPHVSLADSVTTMETDDGRSSISSSSDVHNAAAAFKILREAKRMRQMNSLADDASTVADSTVTSSVSCSLNSTFRSSLPSLEEVGAGGGPGWIGSTPSDESQGRNTHLEDPDDIRAFLERLEHHVPDDRRHMIPRVFSGLDTGLSTRAVVPDGAVLDDDSWNDVDLIHEDDGPRRPEKEEPGPDGNVQERQSAAEEYQKQLARLSGEEADGGRKSPLARKIFGGAEPRIQPLDDVSTTSEGTGYDRIRSWWTDNVRAKSAASLGGSGRRERGIPALAISRSHSVPSTAAPKSFCTGSPVGCTKLLPALCIVSVVPLLLSYLAIVRCNFVSNNLKTIGIFNCDGGVVWDEDLAIVLSRVCAMLGILSGFASLALMSAVALFYPKPSDSIWGAMAMVCAVTSLLEVLVFMICAGNVCMDSTEGCHLETSGIVMVVSCGIWFGIALILTFSDPPGAYLEDEDMDMEAFYDESTLGTRKGNRRGSMREWWKRNNSDWVSVRSMAVMSSDSVSLAAQEKSQDGSSKSGYESEKERPLNIVARIRDLIKIRSGSQIKHSWAERTKHASSLPKDEVGDEQFMLEHRDSPITVATAKTTPSPWSEDRFCSSPGPMPFFKNFNDAANQSSPLKRVESDATTVVMSNSIKLRPPAPPPSPVRDGDAVAEHCQAFWKTLSAVEEEAARRAGAAMAVARFRSISRTLPAASPPAVGILKDLASDLSSELASADPPQPVGTPLSRPPTPSPPGVPVITYNVRGDSVEPHCRNLDALFLQGGDTSVAQVGSGSVFHPLRSIPDDLDSICNLDLNGCSEI